MRTALLVLSLAAPSFSAALQDPDYVIASWSTAEGLPESTVTSMAQSRDGYLWIGSFGGLARFDGVRFHVFTSANTPGLPDPRVIRVASIDKDSIWLGTLGGLSRFQNRTFQRFDTAKDLHIQTLRVLPEPGGQALVWFANFRLIRFTPSGPRPLPTPPGFSPGRPVFLVPDRHGNSAFVHRGKVHTWTGNQWQPTSLGAELERELESATFLLRARDNSWLAASNHGLLQFDGPRIIRRVPFETRDIFDVSEDSQGSVWASTSADGIFRIDPSGAIRQFSKSTGFPTNSIRFVFHDREGSHWVGTNGDGLLRLRPRTFTNYTSANGLPDVPVKSIAHDPNGALLAGTYGEGVYRIENGRARPAFPSCKPAFAQTLLVDRQGTLWVGSYSDGLWRARGPTLTRLSPAESGGATVEALFEDHDSRLWIGGGAHVSLHSAGRFTAINVVDPVGPVPIAAFAQASPGAPVWAAGDGGLYRLSGNQFQPIRDSGNSPLPAIRSIFAAADGSLLLGTYQLGLLRWRDGVLATIKTPFVATTIGAIHKDQTHYWFATTQGLWRIPAASLESTANPLGWRQFNARDGMVSSETSVGHQPILSTDANGVLWAATLKGIAGLNPARLPLPLPHIPVLPESISYRNPGGAEVIIDPATQPRIDLPATSTDLIVQYTSPIFANAESVDFEFKLTNESAGELGRGQLRDRELRLLRLPPGRTRLQLRATNGEGVWNDQFTNIEFHRAPAWLENRWNLLGLGLAFVAAVAFAAWRIQLARNLRQSLEVQRAHEAELAMEHAKQKAEEASRLKTLFLANMSHELRTPMNGILGMTQLLQRSRLDPEQREMLDTVAASGASLLTLLNDILDLSRIESNQLQLHPAPFDVHELIRAAVALVRPRASEKQLTLLTHIDPAVPPWLTGDSLRLRQILVNYLDNAIKFTDAGRVELRLQLLHQSESAVRLRFEVRDQGCGIAADKIKEIFQVFTQVDASATRRHKGCGLGLSIVKRLAEMMQGSAGAESEFGVGSTFWAVVTLAPAAAQPSAPAAAESTVHNYQSHRVLIAEDNAVNQLVLRKMLARFGCHVAIAENGLQAVEMLKAETFDLVFLDVQMPIMSGLEAARHIRASHIAVPLVAVSASVLKEERERCLAAGMDDFIPKPVTLDSLAITLKRHLRAAAPTL